jgi:5-methylcytosine-specific restriction protein A
MYEIEEIIASSEESATDFPDEDGDDFSWIAEPGNAAIKKTDRPVFLYRETVVPPKVRTFFSVEDLEPGRKRRIVLWHGNNRYDAFIEKTVHASPLTRMMWKPDFAAVLRKEYPQWLEFFKKSRMESGDTPSIQFTRRQEPDQYDVELEGAPSREVTADFSVPLKAGDIIDNDTLRAIFRCSPQGAMRRSPGANSLVLISDHTKSAYEDKWIGKVFHFTGMGLVGEQNLSFPQNKALAESKESGIRLWLFEVFEEGRSVYIGEVELAESPYRSRQPDGEKTIRDVWIFPLRIRGNKHPPLLKKTLLETKEETVRKKVHKLPLDQLEFQARYALKKGGRREVVSEVYEHDQIVSEYAKRKADGTCQLCNGPAPFSTRDGDPFLEVHHIVPLAEGGPDSVDNVAALCPNCHRRMHVLNLPADVALLRKSVVSRD